MYIPRYKDFDGRVLGVEHNVIDQLLIRRELSVHGVRPADVRGVALGFRCRVDEHEVAIDEGAVVRVVVQRGTVGPGCHDGNVGLEAQAARIGGRLERVRHHKLVVERWDERGRFPRLDVGVGGDLRTVAKHRQFIFGLDGPGRSQGCRESAGVHGIFQIRKLILEFGIVDGVYY